MRPICRLQLRLVQQLITLKRPGLSKTAGCARALTGHTLPPWVRQGPSKICSSVAHCKLQVSSSFFHIGRRQEAGR